MKDDAHDRERQLMRKLRVYLCNEEEGWFERAEKRRSVQERFGLQSYQLKDYVQKMKSGKDSEILSSDEFMLEEDFRYDWEELKEISVAQSGPALLYVQGRREPVGTDREAAAAANEDGS